MRKLMNGGPLRVGIVGAGYIAGVHLEGLKRHPAQGTAVAICDPSADATAARAKEFGIPATYTSLSDMLAAGGLDLAVICTPTHLRYEIAAPLMEAGVPVFIEKPLSETYEEAARITRKSRETGVPAAVNQNFRRGFSFALAKEALKSGVCGRPLHLTQTVKRFRKDAGWRITRNRYVMAIMSIHWFDGYRWLFGEEPETVYCRGVRSPMVDGRDDTGVSVILTFPSGPVVCLSESFSSYCGTDIASLDCEQRSLALYGNSIKIHGPDNSCEEITSPMDWHEASWFLLNDFIDSLRNGTEPETPVSDNMKTMRILEAAYRSFQEKREVRIEEIPLP